MTTRASGRGRSPAARSTRRSSTSAASRSSIWPARRRPRSRATDMAEGLGSWRDTPTRQAIVDFVERVTDEGGAEYAPARRPDRRVRQRWHAVVREPDADRARLRADALRGDGEGGRVAAHAPALASGARARLPLARRRDDEALRGRRL